MTDEEMKEEVLRIGLELLADGRSVEEVTVILTTVVVCTLDALFGTRPVKEHADAFHRMMMTFEALNPGGRA